MVAECSPALLLRRLSDMARRHGVSRPERLRLRQEAAREWHAMIEAGVPPERILIRVLRGSSGRFRVEWFVFEVGTSPADIACAFAHLGECFDGIFRPLPAAAGRTGPLN